MLTRGKFALFICGKCDWYKALKPEVDETIEESLDKDKNY